MKIVTKFFGKRKNLRFKKGKNFSIIMNTVFRPSQKLMILMPKRIRKILLNRLKMRRKNYFLKKMRKIRKLLTKLIELIKTIKKFNGLLITKKSSLKKSFSRNGRKRKNHPNLKKSKHQNLKISMPHKMMKMMTSQV